MEHISDMPNAPDTLERMVAAMEAGIADVKPEARKQIAWADRSARDSRPLAISYIHGFSASAGETRPLADRVAEALDANLYFTRLTGHGRAGGAMAEASLDAWLADFAETLSIGRGLGRRQVVMACSTGASLATLALTLPAFRDQISALVMVSPNFGLRAAGSGLIATPIGPALLRLVVGSERHFEPRNAAHAAIWTTRYPSAALIPMAKLVRAAVKSPVEAISVPALVIRSPEDQVVSPAATDKIVRRWGGPITVIDPGPSGDPDNHVVAGDALSPETTEPLAARIVAWLQGVGLDR